MSILREEKKICSIKENKIYFKRIKFLISILGKEKLTLLIYLKIPMTFFGN